jgi:hypothetical protein
MNSSMLNSTAKILAGKLGCDVPILMRLQRVRGLFRGAGCHLGYIAVKGKEDKECARVLKRGLGG